MAPSATSSRSTTGCHTCRLRKKKCDELHPVCANCTSRAIPCYGYGAKPAWMKGAGVEEELVTKIKRAAERNYRARRRGWKPEMGEIFDENGGFVRDSSGTGSEEMQGVDDGKSMRFREIGGDENFDGWYSSDFNTSEEEKDRRRLSLSLSLRQKQSGSEQDTTDDTTFSWPTTPSHQASHLTEHNTQAPFSSCPSSSTFYPQRIPSPETLSSLWYQSNFATTYSVGSKAELGLLMHYLDNVFPLQFGFSCMKRHGYRPSRGRDWYLATMLVCRPMYFATLSISAHHLHLMKEGNMLTSWGIAEVKSAAEDTSGRIMVAGDKRAWNFDADNSFLMALRSLQGVLDDLQARGAKGVDLLIPRWQVLATMCQVLSLEVFRNLGGNWPIHVEASRTFLSMIGSSTFSTHPTLLHPHGTPQQPARLDILEQLLRDDSQEILPREHTAALRHFIASFIWVDILSRAIGIPPPSTLTTHPRPFPYLPLLEDSSLDLSLVMGCENWVFIILAKILVLESALCAERAHPPTSSIYLDSESDTASGSTSGISDPFSPDLPSQAIILETQLQRGLRDLLNARAARASTTTACGVNIDAAQDVQLRSSLVTEMFALAAHTYLNVTMHGAWPWLVPVRESVSRALVALEALPTEVLIRVSWPFAITGCMVLEEGRGRVRALVARGRAAGINIGTVWKGMVVVEECWRLRDGEKERKAEGVRLADVGGRSGIGNEVSWVEAMESLGEKILLV